MIYRELPTKKKKRLEENIAPIKDKIVKKSSYFDDGYQVGDVSKTILSTAGDAAANIGKGFFSTIEGVTDTAQTLLGDLSQKRLNAKASIFDLFGDDEYANTLREAGKTKKEELYKNASMDVTGALLGETNDIFKNNWSKSLNEKSVAGSLTTSVEQGIGNIGAFVGLGGLTEGAAGITFMNSFSSSYGNTLTNGLRNGLSEKEAKGQATTSGLAEAISEQFFQGIPGLKTAGWADDLISEPIEKYFKGKTGKVALKIFDSVGEGFEEIISNVLQSTFEGIRKGESAGQIFNEATSQGFFSSPETREAFISALISSALTNGGSALVTNNQKNQVIDTYAKEYGLTKEETTKLFDGLVEKKANLEDTSNYKERVELEENIQKQLVKELKNEKINLNELFEQTPNSKKEIQFRFNQDEANNVKSEKQNILANDMARLNDEKSNHDLYKTINAIQSANDTQQYHITTTEGLYEMGIVNKDANGNYVMPDGSPYVPRGLNYKNGEIYINADVGSQSGTQAVYHEMLEGFKKASPEQYNQFKQMITDIIGEKNIQKEFDTYKAMYGEELTDDIRDEIINDKFGELAENQNFINKIADNRNVLEKFIDSIKNMIKYVKGTDEERQLMKLQKNLEKEFAKRYKETDFSKSEGDTAYSIGTEEDIENYNDRRKQAFHKIADDFGSGYSYWEVNLGNQDKNGAKNTLKNSGAVRRKFAELNNIKVEDVYKPIEFKPGNNSQEIQKFIKDNEVDINKLATDIELRTKYFNMLEETLLKDGWNNEEIDNYLNTLNDNLNTQRDKVIPGGGTTLWKLLGLESDIDNIKSGTTQELDSVATRQREKDLIDNNPKFEKYIDKYINPLFEEKPKLDTEDVMEEAIMNHGTTDNYSIGAYMTTDGQLLNFNDGGFREDHRAIDAYGLNLQEFMDYGAIRMQPEGNGFQIAVEPTDAQYDRLEDYIDNYLKTHGDNIYVDCENEGRTYSINTPTAKIINDIQEYFRIGEFPKQSELAQFRYSLTTNKDGTKTANFIEDRLNNIIDNSMSKWEENYARSYVARISPQDFLNLTTDTEMGSENFLKRLDGSDKYINDLDVDKLKNERQNIYLRVDMQTGQVLEHEGRHRALALLKDGVSMMDIEIEPDGDTYDRYNATPEYSQFNLKGQEGINNTKDATIYNVLAVSKNNLDRVKNEYLNNNNDNQIRYSLTSTKDSQGRELSPQQQEYFKDSKVVDDNGNLKVMYRGGNENINVFDTNHTATRYTNLGTTYEADVKGFFFTDNIEYAKEFGTTKEYYLNVTNPVTMDNIDDLNKIFKPMLDDMLQEQDIYQWQYDKAVEENTIYRRFIDENGIDWQDIDKPAFNESLNIMKELGYDGFYTNEGNDERALFVFNSNQIKSTDNLNPTENDDIRLSLTSNENIDSKEIAPVGSTVEETIAPIREDISNLTDKIDNLSNQLETMQNGAEIPVRNDIAPVRALNNTEIAPEEAYKDENYWKSLEEFAETNTGELDKKVAKKLSKNMAKLLGLKQKQLGDLQNIIEDAFNKGKSVQEIKNDLDLQFGHDSVVEKNNEAIEAQKLIRQFPINVSPNIQKNIADYGYWKQFYFGKIKFSKDGDSVDSVYQQLNALNPAMFPGDIWNETDQLLKIAEVADMDRKYTVDYELPQQTIDEAANYIHDTFMETMYANAIKSANDLEESALQYNERTKDIPYKKKTRAEVREEEQNKMGITADDLQHGNDISALKYQIMTPERVNEDVFGREIGKKINDETIYFGKHQEAENTRWKNKERKDIADLGIKARSKESALVQQYGEGLLDNVQLDQAVNNNVEKANKIKHAAKVIRGKYDTYLDLINEKLVDMGYDPIPKRKDYMRHFQELTDKFSMAGIPFNRQDMNAENLPTDINGLTEFNVPGKNWFASALKRTGNKTTYDAITGIDGYLEGAGNLIFHTETIQRYRALEKLIRDTYGQEHGLEEFGDDLSTEEAMQRIQDIEEGKLSNYAAWIHEQANAIAGKKGALDRGVERALGRKAYTLANTLKKQTGSNMTGFNVRSAMTNFISSTIAASKTNKLAMVKGTVDTIKNIFNDDGFINRSDFLTSRFGSDSISKKTWDKISNAGQIFMTGSDWFTANVITRSKYYEGLQNGLSETEAMNYANDFAARVMGDRSKGATAEAFNSKTLGILTQFQLETNNQWQYMIHDTKMEYQKNLAEKGGLKAGATVLFQMGQLAAYSYLFNEMFEKLTGSRAAFDIADIIKKLFGLDDDDKDKTFEERMKEAGSELVDALPFASLFGSGGRLPIGEMLTPAQTVYDYITGGTNKYGQEITLKDVGKDLRETLPYYVLPTGYGQLKKTKQGLEMYSDELPVAGSYTDSGNLRFTADEDTGSMIKNALFGKWADTEARKYRESGYKTIRKEDIQEMKDLDMKSSEYRDYKNGLKEAGTKNADKIDYINSLDIPINKKNIMAENVLDKDIDMRDYNKYGSYAEFDYAYKNPEQYLTISQITDYDTYNQYKNDIQQIKSSYSTTNERKAAVQQYIEGLDLNKYQKIMLQKMAGGYSIKSYKGSLQRYIDSLDLTASEKQQIDNMLFK